MSLINRKREFEQDILNVLGKYGIKIDDVTSLKIFLKINKLPRIDITYCHQYRNLFSNIVKFIKGEK